MCLSQNITDFFVFVLILALTALSVEAVTAEWKKRRHYWTHLVYVCIAALSYFLIIALASKGMLSPGGGMAAPEGLLGLGLGLMGLVLTALTGLAVATSWRAVDKAEVALEEAEKAASKILSTVLPIDERFARALAYAESLMLEAEAERDPKLLSMAKGLQNAFSQTFGNDTFAYLVAVSKDGLCFGVQV